MTHVLLIRPREESLALSRILEKRGIKTSTYPLFKPHFLPLPTLTNPQALIITSKNALRALSNETKEVREGYPPDLRKFPLYTVGDQTAFFAKKMGFHTVLSASGTSQDLLSLILEKADPQRGTLWHLSGTRIKKDIVGTLRKNGFQSQRHCIYYLEAEKELPEPLLKDLQIQKISHILFFSPHTTWIFGKLLKKYKLEDTTKTMVALCLSQDVGEKAQALPWKKMWVSPKPAQESLLGYFV